MSLSARPRLAAGYDIMQNVGGRELGSVEWAVVAVKNDKIGLTGCDKSGGPVRRGRRVKCAAGGGGDGGHIGGVWVGCP